MTMETNCPLCGRRTIDPLPVRERLRCVECDALVKAAPRLLQACKAVLHAIESAELDGRVLWILPPYQADGVHESANERLQAVIEEAEGEGNPWPARNNARLLAACRKLLEICRWKCSPADEVLLSDGTSNEQAMIDAMSAIAEAETGRGSASFPVSEGIRD